jgi:tannase/feruloyl esterase
VSTSSLPVRARQIYVLAIAFIAVVVSGCSTVARPENGAEGAPVLPVRSCESLVRLALPDTTVMKAATVAAAGATPEYCDVQLAVDNPSNGVVHVGVFLPVASWNGRFVGTGGGGYSVGDPTRPCGVAPDEQMQPCALDAGYATANTDGGHVGKQLDGSFALNPDRSLNWQKINNLGYLSIHEMTMKAKSVLAAYYGSNPKYSYFDGCSQGGRQGLVEAQRYPADYNGIAAGSPAIGLANSNSAMMWPQVVMKLADDFLPQCKFVAANAGLTAACDDLDGVKDGLISNWQACRFDARKLVGTATACGTITARDADVINNIWDGPRDPNGRLRWPGLHPGATFTRIVNTVTEPDGTTGPAPFGIALDWFRYWQARNPDLDWKTLSYDQFIQYFQQSEAQFGQALDADDPNLSAFRDAGAKIVIWHGTYDRLLSPRVTMNYYDSVTRMMGGPEQTAQFARLFIAPGAEHCKTNIGPAPAGAYGATAVPGSPLAAVVDWVEHDKAPTQLRGVISPTETLSRNNYGQVALTRPLCMYPLVARYKGSGSPDDANSFTCATHF